MTEANASMNTDESVETLISASGTLAGIALALVGILAARSSLSSTETLADDLFLCSALGFLIVMSMGYLALKSTNKAHANKLVRIAEWIFGGALLTTVCGAFVLVYIYA